VCRDHVGFLKVATKTELGYIAQKIGNKASDEWSKYRSKRRIETPRLSMNRPMYKYKIWVMTSKSKKYQLCVFWNE